VLRQVKADLVELAPSTQKYELFALYREALDITQGRWSIIESRFRTHFLKRYDEACRPEKTSPEPARQLLPGSDFKLMEADDLEESLAVNTLANAIKSSCVDELMGLNPRIGVLLKDPDLQRNLNPLGPEVIASALMDTFKELDGSIRAKLVLVPMFNKYFPSRVQSVYQEINQFLFNKGILPIPHAKQRDESAPADANEPKAATKPKAAQQGRSQDMFAMLQQLMSLGRIGVGAKGSNPMTEGMWSLSGLKPAGSGGTGGAGSSTSPIGPKSLLDPPTRGDPLRQGEVSPGVRVEDPPMVFLSRLTSWQQGTADEETVAEFGFPHHDGRTNVLHTIRKSQAARDLGQVNSLTLDIVALLFDFILDDRRIPDAMKAIIGRLQIPVLKAAMLDQSIFSNKKHPTRALLDGLAKAAMGWNAEEGHESPLYKQMEAWVQRINNDFIDDIQLFSDVLSELNAFTSQEKDTADLASAKAAQVIYTKEQLAKPRMMAHAEVLLRLESQAMPKLVRRFLIEHWEALLTKIYETQGPESETWSKAISTMDDLVWSVSPKISSDDRKKLLVILPKMLKWLDQGLQFLGTSSQERDPFFADLVKYHTEAVRPGLDDAEFARNFDIAVARPGESRPVLEEPEEFETLEPPAPDVEPEPEVLEDIRTEADEAEEIIIGDVPWAHGELEEAPSSTPRKNPVGDDTDYTALVKNMKRGAWIELEQDNGEPMRAKLAWVSPLRGIYLFTNRLGQRAISINAQGLANKFREGRVRLVDNVPLMDRAVSGLLNKLQSNIP